MKRLIHIAFAMALLGLSSCGAERHVGINDHVLRDNQFVIDQTDSTVVRSEVEEALSGVRNYAIQKPNTRFLGVRLRKIVYCISNPEKNRFPHSWLRKVGEAPVVISEAKTQNTMNQITTLLKTKGCFGSQVSYEIKERHGKDASMIYHIKPTLRYKIDEVNYVAKTAEVAPLLEQWAADSYLKAGECYDQNNLIKERERLQGLLQGEGYYLATQDLINYIIDTTYNKGLLSIEVVVNNPMVKGKTRELQKYRIRNVYIHPNSLSDANANSDTLVHEYKLRNRNAHYKFVYDSVMEMKPKAISRALFLYDGQLFRPRVVKETYNALLNLKNFKYIGIDFSEPEESNDSARCIDAHIRLENSSRHRVSASLELSNMSPFGNKNDEDDNNFIRNGNFGLETVLEYQNKNLFGGAEIFKAEASLLVELPKLALINQEGSHQFHDIFTSFESGLDLSLDVSQFLLPFTKNIVWQRARPHTMISLGGNYQYRNYFERFLADASFGYAWRHNRQVQHQLSPIEMAYVKFFNLDKQFLNRLEGASDLRLKYQYSDHFVMNARYSYIYSNQIFGSRQNFSYLNATVETAGNLLNGLSILSDGPVDENGVRQIFGVPYAQYAKVSIDAKRYFYHGSKNTFVVRALAGVGLPYANSLALPYEKSYFGGGPSTMRAWQLRRLGPGSYKGSDNILERVGDISLVLNVEERFPLFGPLEGSVFVDAGNVWLMNQSDDYTDGEWKWDRCYKELAVGTGLGLRLNISVLTIRFDFAIPVYDPGFASGETFRLPHWRFNQIVTNFGIDYPF